MSEENKEQTEPIENQTSDAALPFISRLTISKVANLGNYENRKIEISVNFARLDAVGTVYAEVEQIIDDINCLNGFSQYDLRRARQQLAKPVEELDDYDVKNIPAWKKTVKDYEALVARRDSAIEKLNNFGGSSEVKDAKQSWDDDDDDYE